MKKVKGGLEMISLLKWRSLSTGQTVEVIPVDSNVLILTHPKRLERYAIFFSNEFDRNSWEKEIQNCIEDYFRQKIFSFDLHSFINMFFIFQEHKTLSAKVPHNRRGGKAGRKGL